MDPVAKDLSGMSTIHAASMGHQLEVVKVGHTHTHTHTCTLDLSIVEKHTHTHTCTNYTHTLSLKHSTKTMVILLHFLQWLVKKIGSKGIVEKTKDGATPLHIAAGEKLTHSLQITLLGSFCHPSLAHGCTEMLQFFLDNLEDKNDINVLDHIHATAAHDAAEFAQQETLLMLLKHGANISIKDTVSVPLVQTQHMLIIIHSGSPNH